MVPPAPVNQLVVLAHPDANSFCGSITRRWQDCARRNHQVCELRDLYADGFDPVVRVNERPGKAGYAPLAENLAEAQRLTQLGALVFVYPVWFGSPPAMLKGYIERVLGTGTSFIAGMQDTRPLSKVRLVQISTSASSEPWLAEKGVSRALHTIFDQYIADVFGARDAYRLHLDTITEGMDERHAAMELARVDELADRVCAEANRDRWNDIRKGEGPVIQAAPRPAGSSSSSTGHRSR